MAVSTFKQTNSAAQTVAEYNPAIDADISVLSRLGAAFAPHAQTIPDMTIVLDTGYTLNGSTLTEVAAQTAGTFSAPASNPRIDRVVINRITGTASIVVGTEVAAPVPPAIPAGTLPVAQVSLQTTTAAITNDLITDERALLPVSGENVVPVSVQIGTNYTYTASDWGSLIRRSNSGTVMADTLPGTGSGVMPAGWTVTVANDDSTALMSIAAGAGASINGAPLGFLLLGPNQRMSLVSDGTNYNLAQGPARARLAAETALYVSTSGSDSSTGLTSSVPFLTIQRAVDVAQDFIDPAGFTLNVQLADGTYTTGATVTGMVGGGLLQIKGNAATPGNVVVSTTSTSAFRVLYTGTRLSITDLQMQTTTVGSCIYATSGSWVQIDNVVFGSCATYHILISTGSNLSHSGSYAITGGAQAHITIGTNGSCSLGPSTITLTGTPNFTNAFVGATLGGIVYFSSVTFSGAATGKRYNVTTNAVISTNGGGANYLPGNVAGTSATGGQYV